MLYLKAYGGEFGYIKSLQVEEKGKWRIRKRSMENNKQFSKKTGSSGRILGILDRS